MRTWRAYALAIVWLCAASAASADGSAFGISPPFLLDVKGGQAWASAYAVSGVFEMDLPGPEDPGLPRLASVGDAGEGVACLGWTNAHADPALYLGFVWDLYNGSWAMPSGGLDMWALFPPEATSGTLDLGVSGAYHLWISSQYPDGAWFPCMNPWTGVVYSGTPHTPINAQATDFGGRKVFLSWRAEIYATWHYQIVVWSVEANSFVEVVGPWGHSMWQFVFYPSGDFLYGTTFITVPAPGDYVFFIRGASWLPPYDPPATGGYAVAEVEVEP